MGNTKDTNLATELLHEIKARARRWFIAFCIMVALEIGTIIGFMWYISLPQEIVESNTQEATDIRSSTLTQSME